MGGERAAAAALRNFYTAVCKGLFSLLGSRGHVSGSTEIVT